MARWTMVIDLRKCIGCGTCQNVCYEMSDPPAGVYWKKVIEPKNHKHKDPVRVFLPINCMHCKEPSCHDVCPTGATFKRVDGIVDINYDLCIGCGACVVACPYMVRTISIQDKLKSMSKEQPINNSDRIGICTKCNFCLPNVEAGLREGLEPGSDLDATPHCVNFCISSALYFGDLDNPSSKVSRLVRENNTIKLCEELGTEPGVYYILDERKKSCK